MKTIMLGTITILTFTMQVFSQVPMSSKDTLTINAGNFKSDSGQAVVMLFRKEDDLPAKPFMKTTGAIHNLKSVFIFADIPFGEYAAILLHDENSNGMVDHSWLGFPKEPLGFSNGWELTIFSGMPSFAKLVFEFSKQKLEYKIDIQ